ncbi:MAG: competence/damage-inducible protein A [Acidobacteria bacterium]|nr:competence/damage-inducible protein A [Acidobacteriota bacterium]
MKACLLAIGSEMLTPERIDTNSLFATGRLNEIGYDVRLKAVVGDDLDDLARAFSWALEWADLIVATGGLGPTSDDLTRDAVARVLQLPFDVDEGVLERIRQRFERRGRPMPANNRRQAMVPRGAALLDNPGGTAPGLWLRSGTRIIVLLPGPPREMRPMLDAVVRDRLAPDADGRLFRRVVRLTGLAESEVDGRAEPLFIRWASRPSPIRTTILAVKGQTELHLAVRTGDAASAHAALDAAVGELQAIFGASIFSTDDRNLETVVGALLRERGLTIAVAESCTGGLLASRLTDVPGSSAYVDRGVVCYSNAAKVDMLGVPSELIERHGAVSEPVAVAMATGIRSRARTSIGVGVTGIAGPGGGSAEKPVGTVCICAVIGTAERVRTFQFVGEREMVKVQASQAALNLVRLLVLGEDVHEWTERR